MKDDVEKQIELLDTMDRDNKEHLTDYYKTSNSYLNSIGLTMYGSFENDLQSYLYRELYRSKFDESIILHPEQVDALKRLENRNLFLSAPTSFGKSYVFLEYILKNMTKTNIIVVPTLALISEYKGKINKVVRERNLSYTVYTNIDFEDNEEIDEYSIFILTHERVSNYKNWNNLLKNRVIDFAVIDEIHKLDSKSFKASKPVNDDFFGRKKDGFMKEIAFSRSLWNIVTNASRFLLIGPNINDFNHPKDIDIYFKKTSFKPVINKYTPVIIKKTEDKIYNELLLWEKTSELMSELDDKKIVYFSGPTSMNRFIDFILKKENTTHSLIKNENVLKVLSWIETNIHKEWYIYDLIKRGILVHNGSIPKFLREKIIKLYECENDMNDILVTSTLIDGVNTSSKHIIITQNKINNSKIKPFDMGNLVGRAGRTNKHFIGYSHHITNDPKSIYDPEDFKTDLKISIFESEIEDFLKPAKNLLSDAQTKFVARFNKEHGIMTNEDYLDNFSFFNTNDLRDATLLIKDIFINRKVDLSTFKLKEKLDIMFEILGVGIPKHNTALAAFVYNRNTLNQNIQTYLNSDFYTPQNKSKNIDTLVKFVSGEIENKHHVNIRAIWKLMDFMDVEKKTKDLIFKDLIKPIDDKFHLSDDPIIRTMFSMGINSHDIKTFKKTNSFKANLNVRNELKIIEIMKSEGIDTQDYE